MLTFIVMCLILIAVQQHPQYPLIIVANRDERYLRPTLSAHFWQQYPQLYAGKDLQAGGTWMGITLSGRFAAVTNFREPAEPPENAISRGELCKQFLCCNHSIEGYLLQLRQQQHRYAGFNLLLGDGKQLVHFSNRENQTTVIPPGIHGISNGHLNEPWPKVEQGKQALANVVTQQVNQPLDPSALLKVLLHTEVAADPHLPSTGVDLKTERLLSSRFIQSEEYGTRCSTVLLSNPQQQSQWWQQSFNGEGASSDFASQIIV